MRSFLFALLIIFTVFEGRATALPTECEAALKTLFSQEISPQRAGQFLELQGQITLHRMAWAYLKAQKNDSDSKLQPIQDTILALLDEKYTRNDPDFIKAREAFESQPLSRAALSDIGPYLKDVLMSDFDQSEMNFVLNESDLKLLVVLSKKERETAVSGKYNSSMYGSNSPQAILNFAKLINSSYKTEFSPEEEQLNVEAKLAGLENILNNLTKKMYDFFESFALPTECKNVLCDSNSLTVADLIKQNEDVQKIIWESLSDTLGSDDLLYKHLSYGDIWLSTSGKVASPSTARGVVKKETSFSKSVLIPKPPQSIGLIQTDPISVIMKEHKNSKRSFWSTLDPKFQQNLAMAITKNDKVFEQDGKIYDRKTARVISTDEALKNLPPERRASILRNIRDLSVFTDTRIPTQIVVAAVNGKQSFIVGGKMYDLAGKELSPENEIAVAVNNKLHLKRKPDDYKGMDPLFLVSRANALKNNEPNFVIGNVTYESLTGRNILSPFRKMVHVQDLKIEKERKKLYQSLSDEEVIVNYHRDFPNSFTCGHYSVIDKKNAEIKVYSNEGKVVFEKEILVGKKKGDQRTVFTKYSDFFKETNQTTGAGVYTIGDQRAGMNYYDRLYDNNLLVLNDARGNESVLAIHQVPKTLESRYSNFNNNPPETRRVSNGCINLKKSDFEQLKKWMGKGCQVYVLPEDEGNHFVLKNNILNFTSDKQIPASELGLYNFNSNRKYSPINITIVNKKGNTPQARLFVKALEDEKQKLMRLYNLDNDDYNDLASLAYGLMGNESSFGDSKKLWFKERAQWAVIGAKQWESIFHLENPFKSSVKNTSRGFTQIKYLPRNEFEKEYPAITKSTLLDPKNSAIATMAYLAEAVQVLKKIAVENKTDPNKVQITRENMVDYLGYIYQGRAGALTSATNPATPDFNTYVQNLRKNMSYIEILQKIE